MTSELKVIDQICDSAISFPEVSEGTSCNQKFFMAPKSKFLFIGPGSKGQGFKAMFKLKDCLPQARRLAEENPTSFQVGKNGWVTARFTKEAPLPKSLWSKWLNESYKLSAG